MSDWIKEPPVGGKPPGAEIVCWRTISTTISTAEGHLSRTSRFELRSLCVRGTPLRGHPSP
jgi:hypothetical protein